MFLLFLLSPELLLSPGLFFAQKIAEFQCFWRFFGKALRFESTGLKAKKAAQKDG